MSDDCLFCKIQAGEIDSKKVYENDHVFAFEDINPQAPTHVLITPREHVATVAEADDPEMLGRLLLAANEIAADRGHEDYRLVFNNGAGAGQSVFHIHLHLLAGRDMTWPPG